MKFLTIFILLTNLCFGQTEKKIKSIREKVIFLNDSIQNYKLFEMDGDYGHSGFISPEATTSRFNQHWYNEYFVHYLNNQRNYNEKGLLISEDWFYKDDNLISSYSYNYTEFDSLARIKETNTDNTDYITTDLTYNYKNLLRSELTYWSEDSQNFSLKLNEYDESGIKLIKESFFSEEGHHRSNFYSYNNEKNTIIVKEHVPNVWSTYDAKSYYQKPDSIGTYYTKYIKYFDKSSQLIKVLYFSPPSYNSDSKLNRSIFYKYDNSKNIIEQKFIYPYSNEEYIYQKKFDNENKLIWEKDDDGNIKEYFYDAKKRIKKLVITNKNGVVEVTFKYRFDKFENWIEQTKIINGIERFIWKREIVYY